MSIHTRAPFSWAGGPIGHPSAKAGVAATAAAVPSTLRREIRLENGWLSFDIAFPPTLDGTTVSRRTRATARGTAKAYRNSYMPRRRVCSSNFLSSCE